MSRPGHLPRPGKRWAIALAALVALLAGGALLAQRLLHDPRAVILLAEGGAEWIQARRVPALQHQPTRPSSTRFRLRFALSEPPARAPVTLRALRSYILLVNGRRLAQARDGAAPWIEAKSLDVAPHLQTGQNVLQVIVTNAKGPPALLLHSSALGIATGQGWQTRHPKGGWIPASPVREKVPFPLSERFPTSAESLFAKLPHLVVLFALGFGASLLLQTRGLRGRSLDAVHVRWLVLGAWILLCANNVLQIPPIVGMDFLQHYKYVIFIIEQGRLPLATDGAQMFQPPLFYLVAAPFFLLFTRLMSPETACMALRAVPMLSGLALVEICYRTSRLVFRGHRDLRIAGTVVGGLLPINLYMSQSVGNEPLAACTTALVVLAAFRILLDPASQPLGRRCVLLGALFGAALLSKAMALLLLPPLVLVIARAAWARGERARGLALGLAGFAIASGLVAGWYFLRNWIELGVPYVGAWDPSLVVGAEWDLGWQYPGYRIPGDLLSFGSALLRPLYASLWGFWDGFYSTLWLDGFLSGAAAKAAAPPWNYDFMLSMALLSLPLTLVLALGIALALRPPFDGVRLFAACSLAIYIGTMIYVYMSVPTYSNVKASYTLGLAPCYLVLIADGLRPLTRSVPSQALVTGYLCVWAAFGYWAYFV